MNNISLGDMFKPSPKVLNGQRISIWKSSKYFIVDEDVDGSYHVHNEKNISASFGKSFLEKIFNDGLIIRIEKDEEKAKMLLLK